MDFNPKLSVSCEVPVPISVFRSPFPHYLHIQTSTVYVTFYLRTAIIWHFYMYFFKNRCAYLVISHIFYIQKSYRKCPVEVCHQTTSLQHQLGSDPVSKYTSCKVVMSVEKDKRTEYIPKIMLFSTHSPSLAYAAR